jgi:hypothetical protein
MQGNLLQLQIIQNLQWEIKEVKVVRQDLFDQTLNREAQPNQAALQSQAVQQQNQMAQLLSQEVLQTNQTVQQ